MPKKSDSRIRLSTVAPMSKKRTILVEMKINSISKLCVMDTGAAVSLINSEQWDILKMGSELVPSDIVAEAANNSPIGILGKTVLTISLSYDKRYEHEFYVADDIGTDILIGLDFIMSIRVLLIPIP